MSVVDNFRRRPARLKMSVNNCVILQVVDGAPIFVIRFRLSSAAGEFYSLSRARDDGFYLINIWRVEWFEQQAECYKCIQLSEICLQNGSLFTTRIIEPQQ